MRRTILLALPTAAALLLPAHDALSERDRSQQEFSKLLQSADKAFAQKDFIASAQSLQQGIMVATDALRSAVLDAMPVPPRGFLELVMPQPRLDGGDPLSISVALNANRPIEQRYRRAEGGGEIRIIVAPNSPATRAARLAFDRVGEDPNHEIVEAGTHAGVLTRRPGDFSIRYVLGGAHLVEVRAFGIDPADLQKVVDQAFLDHIARILGA